MWYASFPTASKGDVVELVFRTSNPGGLLVLRIPGRVISLDFAVRA